MLQVLGYIAILLFRFPVVFSFPFDFAKADFHQTFSAVSAVGNSCRKKARARRSTMMRMDIVEPTVLAQ